MLPICSLRPLGTSAFFCPTNSAPRKTKVRSNLLIAGPSYRTWIPYTSYIFLFSFRPMSTPSHQYASHLFPAPLGHLRLLSSVSLAHLATMKRIATSEYQHWGYPNPYPYQVHCFCQQFDPRVAIDRKRVTGCPYAKQLVVQRTGYGKSAHRRHRPLNIAVADALK